MRLYESRGLVPPPLRSNAGYRLYTDQDIARLRFVAAARQLGLRLDQVADVLAAAEVPGGPCATTHALLTDRINEIDRAIGHLTALRAALVAAQANTSNDKPDSSICPVIEATELGRAEENPERLSY